MRLFALIVAVPLIEIALFVTVGGAIGLWATLAIVLGTGIAGVMILRGQGRKMQLDMRTAMRGAGNPLSPLAQGGMILLAGMLLILPGFFTDMLGVLLLLPPVRAGIVLLLARRVHVAQPGFGTTARRDDVIDGEFIELDAEALPPRKSGPSGWTQH